MYCVRRNEAYHDGTARGIVVPEIAVQWKHSCTTRHLKCSPSRVVQLVL